MKKILIVAEEIRELAENNSRIIIKKDKTIIKDRNIFDNKEFLSKYKGKYKYFLEEWEICTKNKIQIICSNNGTQLRPIHIKTDLFPEKGDKALFQSEKMIIIKLSTETKLYEICKYSINEQGEIFNNVIHIGRFEELKDCKKDIPDIFRPIIDCIDKNYKKYLTDGYLAPIYANVK